MGQEEHKKREKLVPPPHIFTVCSQVIWSTNQAVVSQDEEAPSRGGRRLSGPTAPFLWLLPMWLFLCLFFLKWGRCFQFLSSETSNGLELKINSMFYLKLKNYPPFYFLSLDYTSPCCPNSNKLDVLISLNNKKTQQCKICLKFEHYKPFHECIWWKL